MVHGSRPRGVGAVEGLFQVLQLLRREGLGTQAVVQLLPQPQARTPEAGHDGCPELSPRVELSQPPLRLLQVVRALDRPDPGVLEHAMRRDALPDVDGEHPGHEVLRVVADLVPRVLVELVVASLDRGEERLLRLCPERGIAHEEDVQDDPDAPDVASRRVLEAVEHLRGDVPRRPHEALAQPLTGLAAVVNEREAKVCDLDFRVVVRQRVDAVLGLHVSV
mmetsp:Transcript_16810/g.64004  ORF Transcript_16810/g.64004 Transcript_16810/m.64004 type:complete len:221 (-) Transcript_16810:669-1331(-)